VSYLPEERIRGGIGADEQYWEYLGAKEFRLSRCADCRAWLWPAHWRCRHCGSWEIGWEPVEPVGRVYSWTRTWYVFDQSKGRAGDIPYVTVLAEIPAADGARVLGVLAGGDEGLAIGAPVRGQCVDASPKSLDYPSLTWTLVK
jgi:uncharacterized OB-fold protein